MAVKWIIAVLVAMASFAAAAQAQAQTQDGAAASCRQFCTGDDRKCRAEARRQARAEEGAESTTGKLQEEAIGGSERRATRDEGIRSRLNERLDHCDKARTNCQSQCVSAPAQPASGGG